VQVLMVTHGALSAHPLCVAAVVLHRCQSDMLGSLLFPQDDLLLLLRLLLRPCAPRQFPPRDACPVLVDYLAGSDLKLKLKLKRRHVCTAAKERHENSR
jgi:hypothetical protein